MAFNWVRYLDLAKHLLSTEGKSSFPEAHSRAAVSRAYYAAFCNARNLLRDKDGGHAKADLRRHAYVIDQFDYDSNRDRHYIGIELRRLKKHREDADYEDTASIEVTKQAMVQIVRAQNIINKLGQL